jgi:hypothetical protein
MISLLTCRVDLANDSMDGTEFLQSFLDHERATGELSADTKFVVDVFLEELDERLSSTSFSAFDSAAWLINVQQAAFPLKGEK